MLTLVRDVPLVHGHDLQVLGRIGRLLKAEDAPGVHEPRELS